MTDSYYQSRYTWRSERSVVWKAIVRYLGWRFPLEGTVLELGAGYCDFINEVPSARRIAVDISSESAKHADKGVVFHRGPADDLSFIRDASVDVVFASNLLEHLEHGTCDAVLRESRRVLRPGGRLILMQPNFRLCSRTYFDDPTHRTIFTDIGLTTLARAHGFDDVEAEARFLPFSMASRPTFIPVRAWMVRVYLALPWRPFAGQMLVTGIRHV